MPALYRQVDLGEMALEANKPWFSFLILGICSKHFFPVTITGRLDLHSLCMVLAIAVVILGILRLKFDVVSENEEGGNVDERV